MSYTKSKLFAKSNLSEDSSLNSSQSNSERDDEDPLSIRSLSLSTFGVILAFLTFLLPSLSILIGRPLSKGNEVIFNRDFKKDGS